MIIEKMQHQGSDMMDKLRMKIYYEKGVLKVGNEEIEFVKEEGAD